MLQQLSIQNFALIDNLKVDFNSGLSIITGETGAGKSIILGGLGLILGNRADLSVLKDEGKKCIIEGEFNIEHYNLISFFKENDIDYEINTIIRREITPNGKSRAFINDTPVRLTVLNELGDKLIDIHSQHQTLQLADKNFQFQIIDALAKNANELKNYSSKLKEYNSVKKELDDLLAEQKEAKLQYDYNLFLFNELVQAQLKIDEQESLESKLDKLNNAEAIKQNFVEAIALANNDELGIKSMLNSFKNNLSKLTSYSSEFSELFERFNSIDIEFTDIVEELEKVNENLDVSPEELQAFNDRLQLIYNLQKKHSVSSNQELLSIQETLSDKVFKVENANNLLEEKEEILKKIEKELNQIASIISKKRVEAIPKLIENLETTLAKLSMPNTKFKIQLTPSDTFYNNGKDDLQFLFSANKGSSFESLKKVASGGEMSRIMLAVKALLSKHTNLPTILFDEIDTGVSGEVSNKIALIMSEMSKNMQVISITHLPQIAAKGEYHFKVYKENVGQETYTNIKRLTTEERVNEIAEMLSGKELVSSAIEHAKQLLG